MISLKTTTLQKILLICADVFAMTIAFALAIHITQRYHLDLFNSPWKNFFHFGASKILGALVILAFWYNEQYVKRRPFWEDLLQTYRIIGFFIIINLGLSFVMAKGSLKVLIISFWVIFALILPVMRTMAKELMIQTNLWKRDLFIIGCGETAWEAYRLFALNRLMGYNLKGFISTDSTTALLDNPLPAQMITTQHLLDLIKVNHDCEIIVALDFYELNKQIRLINYLQHNCLYVSVLPEITGLALYGAHIDHFFGNDQLVLRLNNNLAKRSNVVLKRIFDIICVIAGIILLAPVLLLISLAIKLTTGDRIFFLHKRVGKHGKPFYCIKFQTMYPNSSELLAELLAKDETAKLEWEKDFKLKDDPRVTPIGKVLRKTSLDELPQLFNVLKGEMSLVGPRPIIEAEVIRYEDGYYYYQLVLPGISGLWQVSGRNDVDYRDRVRLDEWYVKNWSLWYDIVILIKTVGVVLGRTGAY